MSALEKLTMEFDKNEDISLDGLVTLYKSTVEKLEHCSRYIPTENLEENLENSKKEVSQFLLQDKIMDAVLETPLAKMSDIKTMLEFWEVSALSFKNKADYENSDFVVLKLKAFMETSKR